MTRSSNQPEAILHVAYLPGSAGWLLPVFARLNASSDPRLKERLASWSNSDLSERGLVLSTKLAILQPVLRNLEALLRRLDEELAAVGDIDDLVSRRAGFMPRDKDLPYAILAAVDAFIFEYRSTYEILGAFLRQFGAQILDRHYPQQHLLGVLTASGLDVAWASELSRLRKRLFHESAPWIAIRLISRNPLKGELLVLDSHAHAAHTNAPTVSLDDLKAIASGMSRALGRLHDWLFEEIETFESTPAA